ncbi:hypothetical protein HDU99_008592, partial [Rhizoclosmatium hyalinum]
GTSDATELIEPCGGLPLGLRTTFPIKGGYIAGGLAHPVAYADYSLVVTDGDVTDPKAFGQTYFGPGKHVTYKFGYFNATDIDLSHVPGCVDGANVVMQVGFDAPDGRLVVCIDVTLKGVSVQSLTPVQQVPPTQLNPQTTQPKNQPGTSDSIEPNSMVIPAQPTVSIDSLNVGSQGPSAFNSATATKTNGNFATAITTKTSGI